MVRITTGGTLRGYRSSLARATLNQYNAMNTVLTRQKFNSFADNPAAATKSFRLHTSYYRTQDQLSNSETTISKFESVQSSLASISKQYDTAFEAAKVAQNDPSGGALAALGQTLTGTAESMVKALNAQYGDTFIFAGADGAKAPFELKEGKLYFRGIDMATQDPDELAQLKKMTQETTYVDIGLGLSLDGDGKVISSTAFDSSISGAAIFGVGADGEGDPVNMISMIARLGELYSTADVNGNMAGDDAAEASRLFGKLTDAHDVFVRNYTEIDTRAAYLKNNHSRLESTSDTLEEQIDSNDAVDLADALTSFAWAQYSYNAALRVGNSVLSQSFIDYMN